MSDFPKDDDPTQCGPVPVETEPEPIPEEKITRVGIHMIGFNETVLKEKGHGLLLARAIDDTLECAVGLGWTPDKARQAMALLLINGAWSSLMNETSFPSTCLFAPVQLDEAALARAMGAVKMTEVNGQQPPPKESA
jgi:hypothetical protein